MARKQYYCDDCETWYDDIRDLGENEYGTTCCPKCGNKYIEVWELKETLNDCRYSPNVVRVYEKYSIPGLDEKGEVMKSFKKLDDWRTTKK